MGRVLPSERPATAQRTPGGHCEGIRPLGALIAIMDQQGRRKHRATVVLTAPVRSNLLTYSGRP
jgi:hypothetical protein